MSKESFFKIQLYMLLIIKENVFIYNLYIIFHIYFIHNFHTYFSYISYHIYFHVYHFSFEKLSFFSNIDCKSEQHSS